MSTTSDLLAQATQAIKDLRSADETPAGQQGDEFDGEIDSYTDAVLARFGAIVNANDEVTADVNNTTTKSDVGQLGELSVSDSQPVTAGPVGNETEWIPLGTFPMSADVISTSSTTYTQTTTFQEYPVADFTTSLTNIGGFGVSLVGGLRQADTEENVYARIAAYPDAEIFGTAGRRSSGIHPATESAAREFHLEMKVDGGTGELYGAMVRVWGQIA